MRTLNLTFKGSLGKKHSLKLNYASGDLDAETVRKAMQKIAQTHLFIRKAKIFTNNLFPRKYVDTVSTVIFNDESKSN